MAEHKNDMHWYKKSGFLTALLSVLLMALIAVSIIALRDNNLKMVQLRQAVYQADEQNGDVETALQNLRNFVFAHMNTNLRSGSNGSSTPSVQLVNRFNKAVAAEQQRVAGLNDVELVYGQAQASCEQATLATRAQCIQDYVSDHSNGILTLNLPPKEFYTFDFVSPRWSPDLAGWSLLAAFIVAAIVIVRLATSLAKKLLHK